MTVLLAVVSAWVIVNWGYSGKFVILEGADRAGCNMIEGALGFVSSLEGDWRALSGISPGQSAFLWAVREIAAHPLRFIFAIAGRLHHLLFVKPLVPGLPVLFFLGLGGIYRLRRMEAVRPLLLLTPYLLLLHLLMPVEGRYFLPMWFMACPLTGIFFAALIGGAPQPGGHERMNAKAVFYGVSAPVIAFWALSFMLLIAYPLRRRAPRDLRELETKYPACPWIHEIAAREALSSGELDKAADSRRMAYEAEKIDSRRIDYFTTAFLAGRISGDRLLQEDSRNVQNHYPLMLAALRYIEEGEPVKAGKILPCAMQLCVRNSSNMRYISNDREIMLLREVRRNGAVQCVKSLSDIIDTLGVKRRAALRARLGRSYCGARRPERLFSDFVAENGEENTRTGSATPYSGPTLQACRGIGLVAAPGRAQQGDKF
ncbi:MAG: hypothetical protein COT18_00335 [Elusimicrobia bacterium CG08_land_8_20_14_0_20_59_10]|nr:MAG: hypothetical protein COT18_00335 [Elusimicrobia bacterium CG08_land_8_20_14_0_20_59_10]